jgi:hypothetical protein
MLSEAASSSPISFSLLMWLTMVAWDSRIFLSVNLWWPVVGFVDFMVDFCWVVVVGGGFFLLICGGFCWFVMAGCGFFVNFVVDFCWVGGCRWRIWLFFIGL